MSRGLQACRDAQRRKWRTTQRDVQRRPKKEQPFAERLISSEAPLLLQGNSAIIKLPKFCWQGPFAPLVSQLPVADASKPRASPPVEMRALPRWDASQGPFMSILYKHR